MNRQEKETLVQELHINFKDSQSSFVVDYKGLTVDQMQDLRSQLRKEGSSFRVAKARLLKRAIDGIGGGQELMPYLKDQIGVVFVSQDVPAVAKVLQSFSKDHESLKLIVGLFEEEVLDKSRMNRLASLPAKPVLLSMLVHTLQAPAAQLVQALNMVTMRLILTLKALEHQKKQ